MEKLNGGQNIRRIVMTQDELKKIEWAGNSKMAIKGVRDA